MHYAVAEKWTRSTFVRFPQDKRGIRMAARRTQKGTGREDAVDDVKWVSETTPSE